VRADCHDDTPDDNGTFVQPGGAVFRSGTIAPNVNVSNGLAGLR